MKNQIITVNEKDILIISHSNEKYVAIKPICEAIGVDYSGQLTRIKEDPILGSTLIKITTIGANDKRYKMSSIPLRYVFGWLFKIDSRNVKDSIAISVLRHQKDCYDALFDMFTKRSVYLMQQTEIQREIEALEKELESTEMMKEIKRLKSLVYKASLALNELDEKEVEDISYMIKSDEDEQ